MTEGNNAKGENVMTYSSIESLKIKAKLLQKAKKKAGIEFPLKDAYGVLAKTAGYSSWKEMIDSYELADVFNPPKWSALWKIWFGSREAALLHFKNPDQYLIPYQKQFFICDVNYIRTLGLSEEDSDLTLVGNDWSAP